MAKLLDNSTSTTATAGVLLAPGDWNISLDSDDALVTILIEFRGQGLTKWMKVYRSQGVLEELSTTYTATIFGSGGQDVRVTRTGGTGAVTVSADRIDPSKRN